MSQTPEQIRADIERTRAELSSDVDQLTDQANPKNVARRKVEGVKQSAVGLKDRVMGSTPSASSIGNRVADAPSSVRERTQGNPLAAGVVAFGLGLLVAGVIPASNKEQQGAAQLKEKAEPVTQQVTDAAKQVGQKLQEPAQEAVAAVKDTATDAAQTVRDEGQDAAGSVQDQAQQVKDGLQQERS